MLRTSLSSEVCVVNLVDSAQPDVFSSTATSTQEKACVGIAACLRHLGRKALIGAASYSFLLSPLARPTCGGLSGLAATR
jgi:hypothetical protein